MINLKQLRNDEAATQLLRWSGNPDRQIADQAFAALVKAVETPIREAFLDGDIISDIFDPNYFPPGSSPEYYISTPSPGTENEYVAYTHPGHGGIPEVLMESDYTMLHTYTISAAQGWLLRHAREARWDMVGRCLNLLVYAFVKRMNNDGWETILQAGKDRGIMIYDSDAAAGQFTKRLVTLMQTFMRLNGGGNTASMFRTKLTDLYMSEVANGEMKNWGVDQLDEISRREIYTSGDGHIGRIFGVNLHPLVELGQNQEYQDYYLDVLSGTLGPNSDVELVVGLDLQDRSTSFVMPFKEKVQIYNDTDAALHRQGKAGVYGRAEIGFGVLDNRCIMLGSF